MTTLIESQLKDALAYIRALSTIQLDPTDSWGDGLHLVLPPVIPLRPDYDGEKPVAWLVANDFEGYDLTTEDPKVEEN